MIQIENKDIAITYDQYVGQLIKIPVKSQSRQDIKNAKLLQKQILSDRKKAEKHDKKIQFWVDQGLLLEKAELFANDVDNAYLKEYFELEQQNKKLEDDVKQLQGEKNELINGKYGILDLNSKLNDVKSERDNLKERIEKIKAIKTDSINLEQIKEILGVK